MKAGVGSKVIAVRARYLFTYIYIDSLVSLNDF